MPQWLNLKCGMFHFLFLSNLLIDKGVLLMLDACRDLRNQSRSFVCHFVGAESREITLEKLRSLVCQYKLDDVVCLHGPLYGGDKEQLMERVDAMVFPSFYHNECFPLVLLEAMKHSLPVIASDVGAISDIVEDGVTGILLEARELPPLVAAMVKFMDAPEEAVSMGLKGRERYLGLYTQSHFEKKLGEILREVLEGA